MEIGNDRGQATVELAVVFPAVIIVAVIAMNALGFFGACAEFDRVARQTAVAYGAAPDAGQGSAQVRALLEEELQTAFDAPHLSVAVTVESTTLGLERYRAQLRYAPTLFGLGLRSEVFGVALPPLLHETTMVVDRYAPGVVIR